MAHKKPSSTPLRRSTRPRRQPHPLAPTPQAPTPPPTTATTPPAPPLSHTDQSNLYTYYRQQLLQTGHRPTHAALNAWWAYTHSGAVLPSSVLRSVIAGAAVRGSKAVQAGRVADWARGYRETDGCWPSAEEAAGWMLSVGLGALGVEAVLRGLRGGPERRVQVEVEDRRWGPGAGGILAWPEALGPRRSAEPEQEVEAEASVEIELEAEGVRIVEAAAEANGVVPEPGNKREPSTPMVSRRSQRRTRRSITFAAGGKQPETQRAADIDIPSTEHGESSNSKPDTKHATETEAAVPTTTKPARRLGRRQQKAPQRAGTKRKADDDVMEDTIVVAHRAPTAKPVADSGGGRAVSAKPPPTTAPCQVPALAIAHAQRNNNKHTNKKHNHNRNRNHNHSAHPPKLSPLMKADEAVRARLGRKAVVKKAGEITRPLSPHIDHTGAMVPRKTGGQGRTKGDKQVKQEDGPAPVMAPFKGASGLRSHPAGGVQSVATTRPAAHPTVDEKVLQGKENTIKEKGWCNESEWEIEEAEAMNKGATTASAGSAEAKREAGTIDAGPAQTSLSRQAGVVMPAANLNEEHQHVSANQDPKAAAPPSPVEEPATNRARTADAGIDHEFRQLAALINGAADPPAKLEVYDLRTPTPPIPATPAPDPDPICAAIGVALSPRTAAKVKAYLDARVQSEVDSRLSNIPVITRDGGSVIKEYIDATIQLELQARFAAARNLGMARVDGPVDHGTREQVGVEGGEDFGQRAAAVPVAPLVLDRGTDTDTNNGKEKEKGKAVEQSPVNDNLDKDDHSPPTHQPSPATHESRKRKLPANDGAPGPSRRRTNPLPENPTPPPKQPNAKYTGPPRLTADREVVAEFWAATPLPHRTRKQPPAPEEPAHPATPKPAPAITPARMAPAPQPAINPVQRVFYHIGRTGSRHRCRLENRAYMRRLRSHHDALPAAPQQCTEEETAVHRATLMAGVHVDARDTGLHGHVVPLLAPAQQMQVSAGRPRVMDAAERLALDAELRVWYGVAAAASVVTGRALERKVADLVGGRVLPRGWLARWKRRHGVSAPFGPQGSLPEDPISISDDTDDTDETDPDETDTDDESAKGAQAAAPPRRGAIAPR